MLTQYLISSVLLVTSAFAQEKPMFTGSLKAQVYKRSPGWSMDRTLFAYTFDNGLTGTAGKVDTAPIWTFRSDGNLSSPPLQQNLIDVAPGETGYSDLWQVNIVTVPASVKAGNITSKAALDALMLANPSVTIASASIFVNCPVVHPNSTLEVPADAKFVTGWYKDQPITYFDFGPNGQNGAPPGNSNVQPVWVPVLANATMVGNHVFPGVSTDPGYTAFWAVTLVTVPSGYMVNQFRKAQDWASLNITPTPVSPLTIVNCPIVGTVGAATPFSSGVSTPSKISLPTWQTRLWRLLATYEFQVNVPCTEHRPEARKHQKGNILKGGIPSHELTCSFEPRLHRTSRMPWATSVPPELPSTLATATTRILPLSMAQAVPPISSINTLLRYLAGNIGSNFRSILERGIKRIRRLRFQWRLR
ncbi:hypothetical protein BC830DRAFT_1221400 [Chytriomyces sp. MP71]|nr:hypothetical protein BC830DRAFT_1221400 [Chytriomyces sp. MP71]